MKNSPKRFLIALFVSIFGFSIFSIILIHKRITKLYNDEEDFINKDLSSFNFDLEKYLLEKDVLNNEISRLKEKIVSFQSQLKYCNMMKYEWKTLQQQRIVNIELNSPISSETFKIASTATPQAVSKQNLNENEGDIYPYSAFTLDKLFPAELGIYKRNIQKLTGYKRSDLNQVIEIGVNYLKANFINKSDFSMGFFRSTPINGFEYELYFKRKDSSCCFMLKLNRPINPLKIIHKNVKSETEKTINFILALTSDFKNMNAFKLFLSSFETIAVNQDRFITLTIVLGNEKNNKMQKKILNDSLNDFKTRTNFQKINLINVDMANSSFSRAKLLEIGAESCCNKFDPPNQNENLLFFADVDILFNQNFLNLCRYNAIRSERVYFPILYSFYNPSIVKSLTNNSKSTHLHSDDDIETARVTLVINKETGYWRDTGFGMVCLYKDDFKNIGGFGEYTNTVGWGGEDLYLYRKFLNSSLEIFRSVAPGLFHMYHSKECDRQKLNSVQFKDCIMAKILNEASQKHFGLSHFNITNF